MHMSEFERDSIARCLFNKVMNGHVKWDEMTEPNKDDWRVKADEWMAAKYADEIVEALRPHESSSAGNGGEE